MTALGDIWTARSITTLVEVQRRLADHEPLASYALADVDERFVGRRGCSALVVENQAGEVGAVVTFTRWILGHTVAYPFLIDTSAAATTAAAIDDSVAVVMRGPTSHVQAISAHSRRACEGDEPERLAVFPPTASWGDPDPRCRVATWRDVPAITSLYHRSELNMIRFRIVLAWVLRNAGDGRYLVLEEQGEIVGIGDRSGQTPSWDVWGDLVIDPDHREQNLSWVLVAACLAATAERGAGGVTSIRAANPMAVPEDLLLDETISLVPLDYPRRFKGETRLRRLWEAILYRSPDAVPERRFEARVDRTRRIQAAWRQRLNRESGGSGLGRRVD